MSFSDTDTQFLLATFSMLLRFHQDLFGYDDDWQEVRISRFVSGCLLPHILHEELNVIDTSTASMLIANSNLAEGFRG